MTEGIIQQVFGRFVVLETPYLTRDEILELRDELIKEIKKAFPIEKPFQHVYGCSQIQRKLIGETKE